MSDLCQLTNAKEMRKLFKKEKDEQCPYCLLKTNDIITMALHIKKNHSNIKFSEEQEKIINFFDLLDEKEQEDKFVKWADQVFGNVNWKCKHCSYVETSNGLLFFRHMIIKHFNTHYEDVLNIYTHWMPPLKGDNIFELARRYGKTLEKNSSQPQWSVALEKLLESENPKKIPDCKNCIAEQHLHKVISKLQKKINVTIHIYEPTPKKQCLICDDFFDNDLLLYKHHLKNHVNQI